MFAAIGFAWGAADGTHFNIPDLRGRFLRGWDHGIGRDLDKAIRTACNAGGNTGDNVGTVQIEQIKAHIHSILVSANISGGWAHGDGDLYGHFEKAEGGDNDTYLGKIETISASGSAGSTGGNETRPINANVMYCIKY